MGSAKIAVELKTSVDSNGRSMINANAAAYGPKKDESTDCQQGSRDASGIGQFATVPKQ